jgi:hypothetical protein
MWKLPNSPSPVKQILTISNGNGLIYRKAKFSFLRRCHDVPCGQASRMKCGSSTGGGCLASNRRTTAAGSGASSQSAAAMWARARAGGRAVVSRVQCGRFRDRSQANTS